MRLRSALLDEYGFRHGFSTRDGGASRGAFATLNFGRTVGDDAVAVDENHARFAREIGYEPTRLFEVSQVHGAVVRDVRSGDVPEVVRAEEADALVASLRGTTVAVRTADCVPILLGEPESGAVAAIHAGWRGLVAGVVAAAVTRLAVVSGASASTFVAAIGPHIRVGAFEVGPDVAHTLREAAYGDRDVIVPHPRAPHADLGRVARVQLERAGVRASAIELLGGCTHDDPARFYSFRRDGAESGRHLAAIVARGERARS